MKRFDYRILVGAVLILGGILMLLDRTGILRGASDLYWAGILAIGAAIFLVWFFSDRSKWWAAIPGFTLAGIAARQRSCQPGPAWMGWPRWGGSAWGSGRSISAGTNAGGPSFRAGCCSP